MYAKIEHEFLQTGLRESFVPLKSPSSQAECLVRGVSIIVWKNSRILFHHVFRLLSMNTTLFRIITYNFITNIASIFAKLCDEIAHCLDTLSQ